MVSRELASKLLGSRVCGENSEEERVCIYFNARSDGRVFIKVVVDNEVVAKVAVDADDLLRAFYPAAIVAALNEDEVEELWSLVKGAKKKKSREEKARKRSAKRAAKKRRGKEEPEEEPEEVEEGEEAGEEEEEEELEFA